MSRPSSPSPDRHAATARKPAAAGSSAPPATPTSSPARAQHLNPDATPFSPSPSSTRSQKDELPDWLVFSPSSSKGRSTEPRHGAPASPSASFTEVVHRKGKAPMDEASSSVVAPPSAVSPIGLHGRCSSRAPPPLCHRVRARNGRSLSAASIGGESLGRPLRRHLGARFQLTWWAVASTPSTSTMSLPPAPSSLAVCAATLKATRPTSEGSPSHHILPSLPSVSTVL
jgi:hypothetical protein